MQLPMQVSFRNVGHSDFLEGQIDKEARRLEAFCDHIDSCRVAIERPHRTDGLGGEYRVRIDITVPPGHELVTTETTENPDELYLITRRAFRAAERRLKKLVAQQRGDVKHHEATETQGVVTKLFDDYGFIESDGTEIYFHRNSVLGAGFDALRIGSGVAFTEEPGDEGPQASSVRATDSRGAHRGITDELLVNVRSDATGRAPR